MAALQQPAPPPRQSPGKRVITFSCGLPTFIACIVGMTAGIVWVFVLGILLGRGLAPESHIPKLDRIMPQAAPFPAPGLAESPTAARNTPIAAEDLEYRRALKSRTADSRPATPAREPEKPRSNTSREADSPAPSRTETRGTASPDRTAAAKPAEEKTVSKKEMFDYVYQVASSRDAAQAEALASRLKSSGLKPRVAKIDTGGTTWYKVVVNFRGSPEDTRELRKDLASHNISPRLIMESKTPVR